MKTKKFLNKRKWLNTGAHYDNGWVRYSVKHAYGEIDANFMFADCSRTINLNFSCYSKQDSINHAKKLDILISSLCEFRDNLGVAWQYDQDNKDEETEDCDWCS